MNLTKKLSTNFISLPAAVILVIILLLVFSQYVFVYSDAGLGIVISLLMALGVYIFISVVRLKSDLVRSAESLILIPLYVLFTSSMPWFFIEQQFLLPMVYSLILGLCFWHMYEHDLDLGDVGIVRGRIAKYLVLGAIIAIPTGVIEYLILTPEPAFPSFQLKNFAIDIVYMTFFVGLGEEILFRGIIMNDLKRLFDWRVAVIAQGVIFGVMHMTWRSLPEMAFTTSAGILLGYFYHRTGSLIGPISLHAANNVILVGVLPYIWSV
jgi:membrane protease YdiL (CAAX protease family)